MKQKLGEPRCNSPYERSSGSESKNRNRPDKLMSLPVLGRVSYSYPNLRNIAPGDFIIEKSTYVGDQEICIFLVDDAKLLRKYEPIVKDDVLYHQNTSKFLAYKNEEELNTCYKYVEVRFIEGFGKKPKLVRVADKHLQQHTSIDDNLEKDSLMQFFRVYVQFLLSLNLDSSFLDEIRHQKLEYFTNSVNELDYLLSQCCEHISSNFPWSKTFKESIDQLPVLTVKELFVKSNQLRPWCELSEERSLFATRALILSGPIYDRETMANSSSNKMFFHVSDLILGPVLTYHRARHFKYHLYTESGSEVNYKRNKRASNKEQADWSSILEDCLKDVQWIQCSFKMFKEIVRKSNVECEPLIEELNEKERQE